MSLLLSPKISPLEANFSLHFTTLVSPFTPNALFSFEIMFKTVANILSYHIYTIWLFTYSDLNTIVLPSTAFALLNGIPSCKFEAQANRTSESRVFLNRIPIILLWSWVNLLSFAVNNQRQASALAEDRLNKPWRPMPAGRMTENQAKNLGLCVYPLAFGASLLLGGGTSQCVLLALFGYLYNDLKRGDVSWSLRNILNACGISCFASGALEVALQSPIKLELIPWLLIIGAVLCTTVHTQDMYDQPGDYAAGRKTIPLVFGDSPARWSIVVAVTAWSWLCPMFWGSISVGYLAPVTLGVWVSIRSLRKRSVTEDKTTFRIYNAWLVSIYSLPLVKLYIVS